MACDHLSGAIVASGGEGRLPRTPARTPASPKLFPVYALWCAGQCRGRPGVVIAPRRGVVRRRGGLRSYITRSTASQQAGPVQKRDANADSVVFWFWAVRESAAQRSDVVQRGPGAWPRRVCQSPGRGTPTTHQEHDVILAACGRGAPRGQGTRARGGHWSVRRRMSTNGDLFRWPAAACQDGDDDCDNILLLCRPEVAGRCAGPGSSTRYF